LNSRQKSHEGGGSRAEAAPDGTFLTQRRDCQRVIHNSPDTGHPLPIPPPMQVKTRDWPGAVALPAPRRAALRRVPGTGTIHEMEALKAFRCPPNCRRILHQHDVGRAHADETAGASAARSAYPCAPAPSETSRSGDCLRDAVQAARAGDEAGGPSRTRGAAKGFVEVEGSVGHPAAGVISRGCRQRPETIGTYDRFSGVEPMAGFACPARRPLRVVASRTHCVQRSQNRGKEQCRRQATDRALEEGAKAGGGQGPPEPGGRGPLAGASRDHRGRRDRSASRGLRKAWRKNGVGTAGGAVSPASRPERMDVD
jgi:hypothetical protein